MAELSIEAQEALASSKLGDLKKQINASSWNPHMEDLMQNWGEKAAGLRFMHSHANGQWKKFSNTLTLWSIGITTIASGASLVAASVEDPDSKNIVLYAVGGVGIISGFLQSLKKFYNAEEKAADHGAISKQFGSFYRYMTLQMGLSREDRIPSDQLSELTLKEYERLQQDAPPLGAAQVKLFRDTFKNSAQSVPDICETEFCIKIHDPNGTRKIEKPTEKPKRISDKYVDVKSSSVELSVLEENRDDSSDSSDVPELELQ